MLVLCAASSRSIAPIAVAVAAAGGLLGGAVPPAAADETRGDKGAFGLGLIVGEPTGVCGKLYLDGDTAIDFAAGAAILGRGIQVHADYLWHPWVLDRQDAFALPIFLGGGLRVLNHDSGGSDDDHVRFGLRAPVGLLFDFTRLPLDVFAEVAAVLDYRTEGDAFGFDINGGAGVRYYF